MKAQVSPEVGRGLSWLQGQVQTDGSLLGDTQSIATIFQNRTEATQTLKMLGSSPANLLTGIAANQESNTEYLSRKVITLGQNGWDTSVYANQILLAQNADGGFGGATGYSSNVLDTAWSVQALVQSQQNDIEAVRRGRAYLISKLAADGGVSGGEDFVRLHNSAISLLALQTTPDDSNATGIRGLAAYLLQKQGANGSWFDSSYLTALTLLAVSPVSADTTVSGNARNFLISRQNTNGSWNGDPFLSAIVLRALTVQSGSSLPNPTGTVRGQVLEAGSSLPLPGVTIMIAGVMVASTTSDSKGQYIFQNVPTGSLTITASLAGYQVSFGNADLSAGQILVFSPSLYVNSQTVPLTVHYSGSVVIKGTTTPLAGVKITLSGSSNVSVVTPANGQFDIVLNPGSYIVSLSLPNYDSVTQNFVASAGNAVSAGMVELAPTKTYNISGKVVTSANVGIVGATVQVVGSSQIAVTSSDGSYVLNNVVGNNGSIRASATGYDSQIINTSAFNKTDFIQDFEVPSIFSLPSGEFYAASFS